MKTINSKTLFAFSSAVLLCAATLISSPSQTAALAFEKPRGQDYTGKNCERVETKESSTFGKCESVCKDKEIVGKDVENNRYVCKASKAASTRPPVGRVPVGGKVLGSSANPTPKRQPQVAPKAGKAKS